MLNSPTFFSFFPLWKVVFEKKPNTFASSPPHCNLAVEVDANENPFIYFVSLFFPPRFSAREFASGLSHIFSP